VEHAFPMEGRNLIARKRRLFEETLDCYPAEGPIDKIGNVSDSSRKYHERHLSLLQDSDVVKLKISVVNCDVELLNYLRSRHPLKEVRSWANILIGMNEFCRSALQSGWDNVNRFYSDLKSNGEPRISMHQRELQFAMKLLVLAAEHDDYTYGIHYCHSLSISTRTSNISTVRILRTYRLLSYLFEEIKALLSTGIINIRHINSIHSELEVREKKKYKYKKPKDDPDTAPHDYSDIQDMINSSMDDLFKGLERYAQSVLDETSEIGAPIDQATLLSSLNLTFDIGIEDHVNATIERLGLQVNETTGFIDLGDDDFYEGDDW
jgi:hypothetical protein